MLRVRKAGQTNLATADLLPSFFKLRAPTEPPHGAQGGVQQTKKEETQILVEPEFSLRMFPTLFQRSALLMSAQEFAKLLQRQQVLTLDGR